MMYNIILINSEKMDVSRSSIYSYKNGLIQELDIENVDDIDPDLIQKDLNYKTNIVYDVSIADMPYQKILDNAYPSLIYAIYDPSSLSRNGTNVVGAELMEVLKTGLEVLSLKAAQLAKKYGKENISTILNFIQSYADACGKWPNAKVRAKRHSEIA